MRLALETTSERRRNLASRCRCPLIAARSRVALDAVRLILARIEPPDRKEEHLVDGVIVGAIEARSPALQARDQPLGGGSITTAAFLVHQAP